MDINIFNNKVLIIKDEAKKSFINFLSGKLLNVKLITLTEFKKKYFFDYDNKTIHYICNKYSVIPEIAKTYLNNLYYVDKLVDNVKIEFLYNLKKELLDNKLLYENKLFKEFIKNNKVVVFDSDDIDDFYINIFTELGVDYYNIEGEVRKKDLYSFSSIEEEVSFVASSICKLIKNGIKIGRASCRERV